MLRPKLLSIWLALKLLTNSEVADEVFDSTVSKSLSAPQPTSSKLLEMATYNRQRSITGLPVVMDTD